MAKRAKSQGSQAEQTYIAAADIVFELAVRAFAEQHGLSLSVARACVRAIQASDDEPVLASLLNTGEHRLAAALGLVPPAITEWFDGGYAEPHAYPQLIHLTRVQQALIAG